MLCRARRDLHEVVQIRTFAVIWAQRPVMPGISRNRPQQGGWYGKEDNESTYYLEDKQDEVWLTNPNPLQP